MRHVAAIAAVFAANLLCHAPAWACATCFGAKDDPQTEGMNMAILTLMGVTYTLFLGMIGTAVVIWRKNGLTEAGEDPQSRDDLEMRHG